MKRIMNDITYRDFFFFSTVSILHIAVPKAFPIVMVWFYMIAFAVHIALFLINQPKLLFITYLIKNLFVLIIFMSLLVDDWCWFFQYRGNNNDFTVDG